LEEEDLPGGATDSDFISGGSSKGVWRGYPCVSIDPRGREIMSILGAEKNSEILLLHLGLMQSQVNWRTKCAQTSWEPL